MTMTRLSAFLFAVLAASLCAGCDKSQITGSGSGGFSLPFGKSYSYDDILVARAVDGDTLKLENGERVRLIGIDTPEVHESAKLYRDARKSGRDAAAIQKLGRKAANFTKKLVDGKRVRLEFDVEKHDKYGRLLAYVYLKDGMFVNAEIVKQGYASPYTFPPNVRYADVLRRLYQEARENRRGLWQEE
jgi:micrococcal nuclease